MNEHVALWPKLTLARELPFALAGTQVRPSALEVETDEGARRDLIGLLGALRGRSDVLSGEFAALAAHVFAPVLDAIEAPVSGTSETGA